MSRKQPASSPKPSRRQTGSSGCIGPSRSAQKARADGALRPDLAYTGQQAAPGPEGWVEKCCHGAQQAEKQGAVPPGLSLRPAPLP